jgi:hemin uptake protein HemP
LNTRELNMRKLNAGNQAQSREETHQISDSEVVDSTALLNGQRQVVIAHAGEYYVLRVTKQGKLILTK